MQEGSAGVLSVRNGTQRRKEAADPDTIAESGIRQDYGTNLATGI